MSEVTILVVDDADSTRETIKDVLEEKGYRVLTAEDGVEALRIIEEVGCCDIVLLDLVIPKMDGIEVLRRIKERNCEIEVIIITGFADLDSAIAAVNEGAFGYVQKPVDFRLLDRYIEELLEKQQMRRSLIESEERYRTLFESSPDGIFLLKDVIIECNSEMSRLLGHKMEDIIGRPLSEFAPQVQPGGESSEDVLRARIDAALSGTPQFFEWQVVRADGTVIDTEVTLKAVTIRGEQVIQGIMHDITARKKAEMTLKRRAEFESLIATLSTYFISLRSEEIDQGINCVLEHIGRFSGVDRSYLFLLSNDMKTMSNTHEWCAEGVEPQIKRLQNLPVDRYRWWMEQLKRFGAIHLPSLDYLPPGARAEREILESQSIKSLLVLPLVYEKSIAGFIGFDSVKEEKRWDEEGITLLKIIGEMVVNALKRREAENALRASEEKYRYLAENAGDVIFTVDREGNFTFVTKKVEEITGYTVDEILSMNIRDVVTEESYRVTVENLRKRLKGEDVPPYEVTVIKKDGSEAFLEVNTSVILSAGRIIGVQGVGRDITLRKKLEDELKQQTRNAQLYLDLMVHDITNFNQVVVGYLDLLRQRGGFDEVTGRYLDIICSEVGKSIELIKNVKILSRLSEWERELHPVDLVQVIKGVIAGTRSTEWFNKRSIEIRFSPDGEEYICMADELITHVFSNLIDNAIKYTPSEDVRVDIELQKDGEFIRVSVIDYGKGIPDDQKEWVFQRYIRAHEGIKGSGIGLSLVWELVGRYKGRVWVEDRVEGDHTKGARFVVMLPAKV